MKEPPKYKLGKDGGLYLADEWKLWRRQVMSKGFEAHNTSRIKKTEVMAKKKNTITAENHTYRWKEAALQLQTGRAILFCACMSGTAEPFKGCGAAAIRQTRSSQIKEILAPRWE